MVIKIREMKDSDIDQVYKIGMGTKELAVSKKSLFYPKKFLRKWLRIPCDILLVAEENKKILGFILCNIKEAAYINELAIVPEARGKGVGKILLKECIKQIRKTGVRCAFVLAREDCPIARGFWKKNGFKEGYKFIWMERYLR